MVHPILWFQKPYKIGGTLTDNLLKYEVGAFYSPARHSNILRSQIKKEDRGCHPAQKPVDLMEQLIKLVTLQGQTVLDMFMGSGTTAKMAMLNNRKFVGFEISEEYCDIIKKKLEENIA